LPQYAATEKNGLDLRAMQRRPKRLSNLMHNRQLAAIIYLPRLTKLVRAYENCTRKVIFQSRMHHIRHNQLENNKNNDKGEAIKTGACMLLHRIFTKFTLGYIVGKMSRNLS
jgi:hypothetical protein